MRRDWGAAAIALVVIALLAALGWSVADGHVTRQGERGLDEYLSLVVPAVKGEIDRFGVLPEVLREDPRIVAALSDPARADIAGLNGYLVHVGENIGISELSVFDADGTIIASSSAAILPGLVGLNLAFRPYFQTAMATGRGSFYAVGMKTGIPGYYIASRVEIGSQVAGIVAIKVGLSALATTINHDGTDFALVDGSGVVFLSNRSDWIYRPLHPLSDDALKATADSRQYYPIDLSSAPPLFSNAEYGRDEVTSFVDNGLLFRLRPFGADGWRVLAASPHGGFSIIPFMVMLLIVMVGLLISGGIFFFHQRGQLIRVKSEQSALLEKRVEERTRELEQEMTIRLRTEQNLREAEDELIQATKLAALGQMSAALAHEISQPITALAATLTAAARRLDAGETDKTRQHVEQARNLVLRLQHIVRHLRTFARKEQGGRVRMDVAASITAALELAETRASEIGATIVTRTVDRPVVILGNPVRLEQVLVNLLLNALDAVAGRVPAEVGIDLDTEDDQARILVWDTGPGLPEGFGDKLVEPFFTTKPGQDGLGLGLSISQSILAEFDAEMQFLPREGGGTVCEVRLPLATGTERIAAAE